MAASEASIVGPDQRGRIQVIDGVLAAAVAALVWVTALVAPAGTTDLDLVAVALVLVSSISLVIRRRVPVTVLTIASVCVAVYQLRDYPGLVTALPVLVAVYTAVRAGHRVAAGVSGIALVFGLGVAIPVVVEGLTTEEVIQGRVLLAGWVVAASGMGEVSRKHRAYLHEVEQRALAAERSREETGRLRAGEERLRIARELHDSLTHSLSVIKVQVGVAIHLARKRGEEVPEALTAIEEASREAVGELRSTLEVLRTDDADGIDVSAGDGSPGGGLDHLPELVERMRTAGIPATVTASGDERVLPAAVDRAAYRIIQEALTNITRHAGPASVSIRLRFGADTLTVQVDDDGDASPGTIPVPGVGLTGMRERVEMLGGSLRAQPRSEGGFTVRAELPMTVPVR